MAETRSSFRMADAREKKRVVVAGASGLVGTALVELLSVHGHEVVKLVRRAPSGSDEVRWDPERGELDPRTVEGAQAFVCLSGENVGEGRWTEARKRAILESRIATTSLLAKTAAALDPLPSCFVGTSAVGYYGAAREEPADESAPKGTGFLADVCEAWEEAARPASEAGIRTAIARIGVVIAKKGGALAKLLPVFRVGGGGPVGGGRQWMSWVSLADTVRAIERIIEQPDLSGPINVVGPRPVDNATFTRTLASAVHRPAIIPVPRFAIELMFGEMGKETVLASQHAIPKKLLAAGFEFQHPTIDDAIRSEIGS